MMPPPRGPNVASVARRPFRSIASLLDRFQPSESVVLGAVSVALGLAAGGGVWLFKRLIELVEHGSFGGVREALRSLGGWSVAIVPAAGGLVVGLVVQFLIGRERHHGVAGIMEAVTLGRGRLRWRRMPAKAGAAALAIGTGASVGPEDPSVQIGSNLGSLAGQVLRLSDDRVRALVAAGAAAGIAAAFNAPIAGVFFAVEIVLGELGGPALGVVVLSAVISSVFTQAVSGTRPAFAVPPYSLGSAWEMALYVGLGLAAGLVAAAYVRLLDVSSGAWARARVPTFAKPAAAGLAVGIVAVFLPGVLGIGYPVIEEVLADTPPAVGILLALLAAKLVLTPLCIGAGVPGGVFAPALFLGAVLGGAYWHGADWALPDLHVPGPAFAMVGMAAVLGAAVQAPLTATLLLFELTNDYRIVLPVLLAVTVSMFVARRFSPDSVYTQALARKGIRLSRGRDVELLEGITVAEVMRTSPPTIQATATLEEAAEVLRQTRHHGLPVVDADGALSGVFTVQDLDVAQVREGGPPATVAEACTHDLLVAHPDETLASALLRMGARDVGRLPVVARDAPRRLVGLLRRGDLVRAYDVALTRRAAVRHRASQVRLGATAGIDVDELLVAPGSACDGKAVRDVPWPRDCVLATVRRGRGVLLPRGDTVLASGDVIVALAEGDDARSALHRLCAAPGSPG